MLPRPLQQAFRLYLALKVSVYHCQGSRLCLSSSSRVAQEIYKLCYGA